MAKRDRYGHWEYDRQMERPVSHGVEVGDSALCERVSKMSGAKELLEALFDTEMDQRL